ncbi:MAG: MCE family protein [Bacteroidales bacterium]|nr:MCE family protein [Bacteroidales bacterium]
MKYSKELKIGVFFVTVATVSFFVINYLRGEDIFNKEMELTATYANAEGLVSSAPVFIKGFKAGKVSEVSYQPETDDFKVVCSVRKEFRIPEDSRMTIYGVDIMGTKGVKIELGSSDVLVGDGAVLASGYEAGLVDGLAASITPLMEKVGNTLDSLTVTVAGVNELLSESNKRNLTRTIAHLEKTMADVSGIASLVNGKSSELNAFIDNLAALSEKFDSIAEKVDTTMSGVSSVVNSFDEADVAAVVSSFRSLLEKINDPDGTIGKLLVDNSVYNSVDELLNDVDSLVKKIEENPKKYIKISVF